MLGLNSWEKAKIPGWVLRKAVLTSSLVSLSIKVIVLYSAARFSVPAAASGDTFIKSPTANSVVKTVPTPIRLKLDSVVDTVPEVLTNPLFTYPKGTI